MIRAGLLLLLLGGTSVRAADDIKIWSEKVAGSDLPFAVVEAVVDAPPARVWELVSHCNNYVRTMPRIVESKELAREGSDLAFTTTCRVVADLPFPLSDLTSVSKAVHVVEPDQLYMRKFSFVAGDYEINEGAWLLLAFDGGRKTKVNYRLRAKPKFPLPDAMLASFQQQALPDLIKRLRELTAVPASPPKP